MKAQELESAADLIARLGIPPRDICLDWAWQLREIERHRSGNREQQSHGIGSRFSNREIPPPSLHQRASRPLDWQDLMVDGSGRLYDSTGDNRSAASNALDKHRPGHAIAEDSIERLLTQVLEWSRRDSRQLGNLNSAGDRGLEPATSSQGVDGLTAFTGSGHIAIAKQATFGEGQSNREDRTSRLSAAARRKAVAAPRRKERVLKAAGFASLPRFLIACCSLVAVMLAAAAVALHEHRGKPEGLSTERDTSRVAMAEVSTGDAMLETQQVELLLDAEEMGMGQDAAESQNLKAEAAWRSMATLTVESPVDQNSQDQNSQDQNSQDQNSQSGIVVEANDSSSNGERVGMQPPGVLADVPQTAVGDKGVSSMAAIEGLAVDPTPLDVASEIASMTAEAERLSKEVEVTADVQDLTKPPLSLPASPVLQLQKFQLDVKSRAKELGWRLRILPQVGFEVTPDFVQTLARGQTVAWTLQRESAPQESLQIVVNTQMVGSRGDRLRWRVSAIDSELPQIALPMDRIFLQRMRLSLLGFESRLDATLATWKQMGTSGMTSEAKASLLAARRAFEHQLQMAERMLESVMRAEQLVRSLDGEFEIAAEFVDLNSADSPALLQFGTLQPEEDPASRAAEDTPPAEDGDGSADE